MGIRTKEVEFVFNRGKFANELRKFRQQHKLTQREAGELVGVTNAWSVWESKADKNKSNVPSLKMLVLVCNLIEIHPGEFFTFDGMEDKNTGRYHHRWDR